jgi:hypothetical protein
MSFAAANSGSDATMTCINAPCRPILQTCPMERAIRPHTLSRKNVLFAGSDCGAERWALAMALIQTAKLNGVDPMAWLTDVLERVVSGRTKAPELHTLLPWEWEAARAVSAPARCLRTR